MREKLKFKYDADFKMHEETEEQTEANHFSNFFRLKNTHVCALPYGDLPLSEKYIVCALP